jgi:uncharacterized protein YndB with AHSA1/START domain
MNDQPFDPGPRAKVEMLRTGTRSTLVFIRTLKYPPNRVWKALTDPEQLSQWAPFRPDRNLEATGNAKLKMIDGMSEEELESKVSQAIAPRLLEYTWGDNTLAWELEPEGDGTRLTLRHTVESPDWVPKVAAGWHICLLVAERMMDGNPIGPITGMEAMNYGWQELHDAYASDMGIEP